MPSEHYISPNCNYVLTNVHTGTVLGSAYGYRVERAAKEHIDSGVRAVRCSPADMCKLGKVPGFTLRKESYPAAE